MTLHARTYHGVKLGNGNPSVCVKFLLEQRHLSLKETTLFAELTLFIAPTIALSLFFFATKITYSVYFIAARAEGGRVSATDVHVCCSFAATDELFLDSPLFARKSSHMMCDIQPNDPTCCHRLSSREYWKTILPSRSMIREKDLPETDRQAGFVTNIRRLRARVFHSR